MILLFGSYYLFGISDPISDPISNQIHLINKIKEGIDEVKRSTDQYVDSLKEYCELKAIDDSWFSSLSEQQKNRMYQLREYLGFDVSFDVNAATNIVRKTSEEVVKILSLQLSELENVLYDMNLEEMKKLQKEINKKDLPKEHIHESIKSQITRNMNERIRSQKTSKSTELQARGGILYQMLCGLLVLMELAAKMFLSDLLNKYLNVHIANLISYVLL